VRRLARPGIAAAAFLALLAPGAAAAEPRVEVVPPFDPAAYADEGAVGLLVPGAGPTVTRESALNALLTGEVQSSYLGGTPPGRPRIALGPGGEPRILLALPPPGESENDVRYPIAVLGGERGVLTSGSTRIRGLVSIADVASGRLRVEPADDPAAVLERLDRRIERNERIRLPLTLALVAAAGLAALLRPRLAPRVFLLALAGNLWLAGPWAAVPLAAAALALPLGWASAATLAAYLAVLGLDPEAAALSPFGPSQAGRFYGVSNLLETILLVPALLGASVAGRRLGAAVAVLALLAVGGNRFGADGGGLLVLLAGYGALLLRLRPRGVTVPRALTAAGAAAAAAALLVAADAALGGSSHVTDALADGPGALLGDLGDRLSISVERTLDSPGATAAAAAGLAALIAVATRRGRGPATDALLVALAVSLLVNDTPTDVLGVGGAAAVACLRYERVAGRSGRAPG
jgi:hypothetical protein